MGELTFNVGTGVIEADAAIMETGKVDLSVYTSQERFDAEREVFGRVWLNIAEAAEIPNAGDWIVREVKIRSSSIIIVRGKDNLIRAFHNICAHRGMKLVWDTSGLILVWKQMQQGSFRWPPIVDGVMKLSSVEFAALVDGLDWTRVQETRRIHKPSTAA